MAEQQKSLWKPGKRDVIFLGVVAAIVLALVLGSTERKTIPVPSDEMHRSVTSKAACMECHASTGIHPQPPTHTKMERCFLCHTQPEGWTGAPK